MMTRITTTCLAVLLMCTVLGGANAQSVGSTYTSTAPKDCRQLGKPSDLDGSTTRMCPGKDGLMVLIAEDDLREIVSVGRNRKEAAEEPAAKTWFAPFNSSETTGAPPAKSRLRSSSAGTSPTAAIPTSRDGRTPSPCLS
ncbi:hypothetical protein JOE50_001957 [Bradyrhizobium japonicum]|nr:hypothetical protein [Bradyrhizobium japonicum]